MMSSVTFDSETTDEGNRKRKGKLVPKKKRSLDDRETQTHGSLIKIFRQSQMSFSIRRE